MTRTAITLFTGGGGADLGLRAAGIIPIGWRFPMLTDDQFRVAVTTAARVFGIEPAALTGRTRRHTITVARHALITALRPYTTLHDLARRFGCDHATIRYAIIMTERRCEGLGYGSLRDQLMQIRDAFQDDQH